MLVSRRRFGSLALTGLAGIQAHLLQAQPRPKLIVLLISEQFRSDYLDLYSNFLGVGGFHRLTAEGSYFPECQMGASTFTSGGLATIATGAYPQVHGIVADTWYDRSMKKQVPASPQALQGTTLADELAAADPGNRVFGVALDPRDAGMLGDRAKPNLFFMGPSGEFEALGRSNNSAWLSAFNQANSVEQLRNAGWFAIAAKKGAPPLRTLTYDPKQPAEFPALYKASPFAQTAQMALAREIFIQERLGQGAGTDLLTVALGSMALLGYEVGGNSPLMREMVLHLDKQIELLLALLDKNLGPRNYTLVFTSAHGAARETAERTQAISGKFVARNITDALSNHYDPAGAKRRWVERYIYPF